MISINASIKHNIMTTNTNRVYERQLGKVTIGNQTSDQLKKLTHSQRVGTVRGRMLTNRERMHAVADN